MAVRSQQKLHLVSIDINHDMIREAEGKGEMFCLFNCQEFPWASRDPSWTLIL